MPRKWTQQWGRVVLEAPTAGAVMTEAGQLIDELVTGGVDPHTVKVDVSLWPDPPSVVVNWKAEEQEH